VIRNIYSNYNKWICINLDLSGSSFTGNTIGDNAFYDCSGYLTSIIIPSSVTSIGKKAFWYTGLSRVTFAAGSGSITFDTSFSDSSFLPQGFDFQTLYNNNGAGKYEMNSGGSGWGYIGPP
jgi:hypothetical protein